MTNDMNMHEQARLRRIKAEFQKQFGHAPQFIVRAPGRVNLIGEHTDYNRGFVLPAAIDRDFIIAASEVKDEKITVWSNNYEEKDSFALANIQKSKQYDWSNYLRGVVSTWQAQNKSATGFNAVIDGTIPQGCGLSSSAAYEIAVATLLDQMCNTALSPKEIALLAQKSENDFVGVQCGIMDQFVSVCGKRGVAVLLDCKSLTAEMIPLDLERYDLALVITNSGISRSLASSNYNQRKEECDAALELLIKIIKRENIKSLRDIPSAEFIKYQHFLPLALRKRCLHVVEENDRVLKAAQALVANDVTKFGELMNESHASLRDNFAVSLKEIDLLVSLTQAHPGVLGSRLTGAGFGGCTVSLMNTSSVNTYINKVLPQYEEATGIAAQVYIAKVSDGASLIERPIAVAGKQMAPVPSL